MPVTSDGTGTQTATLTTEHTLWDSSQAGVYKLKVDLSNMADGDVLELRVYDMVVTGGTRRVNYKKKYINARPADDLVVVSVPFETDLSDSGAVRATLKQTVGTGRNYIWKVVRY